MLCLTACVCVCLFHLLRQGTRGRAREITTALHNTFASSRQQKTELPWLACHLFHPSSLVVLDCSTTTRSWGAAPHRAVLTACSHSLVRAPAHGLFRNTRGTPSIRAPHGKHHVISSSATCCCISRASVCGGFASASRNLSTAHKKLLPSALQQWPSFLLQSHHFVCTSAVNRGGSPTK